MGLFLYRGAKLVWANTHFGFKESAQEQSAAILIDFLSYFPKSCPAVITGDFNSKTGSRACEVFKDSGFDEVFSGRQITPHHNFTGKETFRHED